MCTKSAAKVQKKIGIYKKNQKKVKKICTIQKKAVPLHPLL
jgi:hypothetical protein